MEQQSDDNLWVMVADGAIRYLGKLKPSSEPGTFRLTEAFELVILRLPQPSRDGIKLMSQFSSAAIGLNNDVCELELRGPKVVMWISKLPQVERDSYMQFIKAAKEDFLRNRGLQSNLTLATAVPPNGLR